MTEVRVKENSEVTLFLLKKGLKAKRLCDIS